MTTAVLVDTSRKYANWHSHIDYETSVGPYYTLLFQDFLPKLVHLHRDRRNDSSLLTSFVIGSYGRITLPV